MRKLESAVILLIALACIWIAGSMHRSLTIERQLGLPDSDGQLQDAPPLVAFTTVVLGGFSGLLADVLWLRVSRLQDEGKYFELVQLSDWITKLEPRCGDVWAFHSWNMAYNISVTMSEPADQWRWIMNGMRLLRDEGMKHASGDAVLFRELGILFQFKIGGVNDPSHMYYIVEWAREMQSLFQGDGPDMERVKVEPAYADEMTRKFKLVPSIMAEVDEKYGPQDWRMPYAHAIYWAHRGSQRAVKLERLQCDRIIYQSVAASFFHGRLVVDETNRVTTLAPNFDVLPNAVRTFEGMRRKYRRIEGVRNAYSNFLAGATFVLNRDGRTQAAHEVFELLARRFPSRETAAGFDAFLAANEAHFRRRLVTPLEAFQNVAP